LVTFYHIPIHLSMETAQCFLSLENRLIKIVQNITHFPLTILAPACKMIKVYVRCPSVSGERMRFMITGVTAGGLRFTSL